MEERLTMFRNRLTKVYRHLNKQARRLSISCYRIYDHDLPEFPFCIEVYEKKIYVAEYLRRHGMNEEEHAIWLSKCLEIISEVLSIQPNDIYLKLRKRKADRQDQYRKQSVSLQPATNNQQPTTSNQQPTTSNQQHEFIVKEAGLKFIINLSDYLDTGLFLDHRITRQMVREKSKDKKLLNLFAYTGSFSLYAADGGAVEVVTVDLSKTYLEWAQRNFQLNGFNDPIKYKFIHADVLQWLESIPGNYFDIIVLDPPTFSNSKRMQDILDVQRDHVAIINKCLSGLRENGSIYFSTNYQRFKLDPGKINSTTISDITAATTPFDFEGKLQRKCFLIEK